MRRRSTRIRCLVLAAVAGTSALGGGAWWARGRLAHGGDPLAKARAAYDREDWQAAADRARERLRAAPEDPEALRLLARASARLGRDDAAAAIYGRLGPSGMEVEDLCVLGRSLMRVGNGSSAIRVWEDARARDPAHAETLFELSRSYLGSDRLEDAAKAAAELAARPGWESRGEALLGAVQLERNDPAGAIASWRRALGRPRPSTRAEGVPSPIVPTTEMARALLRAGRPDEARDRLRLALAASPDAQLTWLLSRADLQLRDWSAARADIERGGSFRDEHPLQPEPGPLVGASRCAGCHPEEFRSQQASRHARTFQRATELGGLKLPRSPVPDPAEPSVIHSLRRDAGGRIRQETKVGGEVREAVVQYAFGSGDRGRTLVGRDPAGRAYELRLSEYPEAAHGQAPGAGIATAWDVTSGHSPHPDRTEEYLGKPLPEAEVRRCLLCHVTDPRSIEEGSGACAADRSIGCERCHGPGGHHLLAVEGKLADVDPAIARPTMASGPAIVKLCSECHSPRGQEVVREDPTAPRFQGATLTWSRCYSESDGALDCITCHDPHRDASSSAAHYEARCLECHARAEDRPRPAGPADPDRRRSSRRGLREAPARSTCPVDPSSGCIGCHMPPVSGIVPHSSFTDHFIRVHRD